MERRQFGRRQTYQHGIISLRGRPPLRCVMRDVSDGGAMLEVGQPEWVPARFRLVIEATGLECDCEVVHRTGAGVGVRFLVPTAMRT
jgi:methyl-accepting chemotaxis protein